MTLYSTRLLSALAASLSLAAAVAVGEQDNDGSGMRDSYNSRGYLRRG
jgi:hypothetical protein